VPIVYGCSPTHTITSCFWNGRNVNTVWPCNNIQRELRSIMPLLQWEQLLVSVGALVEMDTLVASGGWNWKEIYGDHAVKRSNWTSRGSTISTNIPFAIADCLISNPQVLCACLVWMSHSRYTMLCLVNSCAMSYYFKLRDVLFITWFLWDYYQPLPLLHMTTSLGAGEAGKATVVT